MKQPIASAFIVQTALAARRKILPDRFDHGWFPFVLLLFLLPIVFRHFAPAVTAAESPTLSVESLSEPGSTPDALGAILPAPGATLGPMTEIGDDELDQLTVLQAMSHSGRLTFYALPLFLILYFTCFRTSGRPQVTSAFAIAVLGGALMVFDTWAVTYLSYAAAIIALSSVRIRTQLAVLGLMMLPPMLGQLYASYGGLSLVDLAQASLSFDLRRYISSLDFGLPITTFCIAHVYKSSRRKDRLLLLSRQHASRMGALAERERIARDLHDLLGHTLSMIALKADLAGKLLSVDLHKAGEEMSEVAKVSRQALSEVREAITGMRNVAIASEAASMQTLLEGSRIALHFDLKDIAMAETSQQALAMALREAATNIHRHSRATQAWVTLDHNGQQAQLEVKDNGVGGEHTHGNGLLGMADRLRAIGGGMEVCIAPGNGTLLRAWAPLHADPSRMEET